MATVDQQLRTAIEEDQTVSGHNCSLSHYAQQKSTKQYNLKTKVDGGYVYIDSAFFGSVGEMMAWVGSKYINKKIDEECYIATSKAVMAGVDKERFNKQKQLLVKYFSCLSELNNSEEPVSLKVYNKQRNTAPQPKKTNTTTSAPPRRVTRSELAPPKKEESSESESDEDDIVFTDESGSDSCGSDSSESESDSSSSESSSGESITPGNSPKSMVGDEVTNSGMCITDLRIYHSGNGLCAIGTQMIYWMRYWMTSLTIWTSRLHASHKRTLQRLQSLLLPMS
jgi:hypothetical protein